MKTTNSKLLWTVAVLAWSLLSGCAQTEAVKSESTGAVSSLRTNLEPLGGLFEPPFKISAGQTRLVIYRTGGQNLAGATGIFVDGTYHASVIQGAWSQLCYRPGPVKLGARQMQVGARATDLFDSITAMQLAGGQTHFIRVSGENGRPVLKPVAQAQAIREMEGTRQQLHTISRVSQDCIRDAETATTSAPEPAPVAVQVFFEFDKSDLNAITPASRQQLDAQLSAWRHGVDWQARVQVVGHADPLGKPGKNDRLAQERAHTVREYLKNRLPGDVRVVTQGRGADELMVSDCERSTTPQSIACNARNRRVEVWLLGPSR